MKTTYSLFPGVKNAITLFVTTLLVISSQAQVQTAKKSKITADHFGIMASLGGNGFGLTYSPQLGVKLTDRIIVAAGPVLKSDKPHYAGFKVNGNYMLLKSGNSFSGRTGLYAFVGFERIDKQYFSKHWIEIEELTSMHSVNKEFEFNKLRFTGFEVSTGFALSYKVSSGFSLNSEFGLAVYKTKQMNYQTMRIYHEPVGFVMHLSLAARFKINRN